MLEWLAPISLFWTCAALYLGGFKIEIRGGGGFRQMIGVIGTFVLYLGAFYVVRMVLRGPFGTYGGVAAACLVATLLLPVLSKVAFMVMGVRITRATA